nr:uncharacterized protein LOC109179062 [Ipomoea batatas]
MSSQDLNLTLEKVTKTYRKRKRTTNTEQTQTERSSDCAREERSKRNQDCAREERSKRNQDRGQSDQGNAPTVVKKEKGKGKIQPTNEPRLLNSRMSPMDLSKLLPKLTDEQKNAVREIGFGSLLEIKLSNLDRMLTTYLVKNFDVYRCVLRLEKEEMLLTEDDVESTLGLPKSDIQVVEGNNSNATIEYNNLVEEWRVHWRIDSCSPLVKTLSEGLGERKDHGDMFKRDFVVFVISSLFKGHAKWTSNFKLLYSLIDVNNIKNLNWCGYIFKSLIDSVEKWTKTPTTFFTGPLIFLVFSYIDRLQFKGQQIERKFPAISAWTVDMVQKRFADEKRSGAFGRGKVLDRVRKPVVDVENNETIQGKEKESDGVEVQVLVGDKAAMSDVEKISTEMKILAAAIVKFGKAMAEVGSKNMGKDIIKKTFSKMSDMLTVASTSQPAETSTLLDDDPIFNDEGFLAAVSAMEKAFIVTTNPAEHPKEVELDGLPSSPRWNLLTPTPRMFKSQMKQPPHALLNTMHLPISKRLKKAQQQ